ncbi:MAG: hypothetical protein JWN40_759, partial [Phycisphaerales bacterium]|nr:hypothetical protein [Phycisphaerales bacterium]
MFFDRPLAQSGVRRVSAKPKTLSQSSQARRRGAMIALAVAVGSPASMWSTVARAASPAGGAADETYRPAAAPRPFVGVLPAFLAEQPKASDADMLRQGVDQFSKGQYEESLATLQQVKPAALSADEKKSYEFAIKDAESAANERKFARAAFEQGQAALDKKDANEALKQFQMAANNKFADEGTKRKAAEQIALSQAVGADTAVDTKTLYHTGRDQYRKGDWIAARKNLEAARSAGFRPGLFEESADSILAKMDRKEQADAEKARRMAESGTGGTGAAAVSTSDAGTGAAPAASTSDPKASYQEARKLYRDGDWINARKQFEMARDGGYRPGLFEDAPQKYLDRMDKKESADRAKNEADLAAARSRETTAVAQVDTTPAKSGDATPTAVTPTPTAVVVAPTPPPPTPETTPAQPPTPAPAVTPSAESDLDAVLSKQKIQEQEKQFLARKKVDDARAAQSGQRYVEALRLYSEAATLDPNNEQARTGRDELMVQTGAARPNGNGRLPASIEIRKDEIRYRFNEQIKAARAAIAAGKFEDARNAVANAEVARDADASLFTPAELAEFNAALTSARA